MSEEEQINNLQRICRLRTRPRLLKVQHLVVLSRHSYACEIYAAPGTALIIVFRMGAYSLLTQSP